MSDRLQWTKYFMNICETVALNSKCLSRKIGAIIVRDNRILVTGYNGPPSGFPHCGRERILHDRLLCEELAGIMVYDDEGQKRKYPILESDEIDTTCPRRLAGFPSGEGLHLCYAEHAERNCIATAAKNGVMLEGGTCYLNTVVPCRNCMSLLIQAGVRNIVCKELKLYDKYTALLIREADVDVCDTNHEFLEVKYL